ncbi:MAG: sodium/solute symporter [Planctomycetia bacterium]|nr:sodium/solute symporter [Planctomycetia bacterium]
MSQKSFYTLFLARFLYLFLFFVIPTLVGAAEWKVQKAELPTAVARPYFGVFGGKEMYLLGGSNFSKSPNDGGVKEYLRDVVRLTLHDGEIQVETVGEMPVAMAEGCGIVVPAGTSALPPFSRTGLLCVGGLNAEGEHAEVFFFSVGEGGKLHFDALPPLPEPAKMLGGGLIGNTVYVQVKNRLYAMNLNQLPLQWKERAPLPAAPREQAVVAVQGGEQKVTGLYVFGGFRTDSVTQECLTDAWFYNPLEDTWRELPPVQDAEEKKPIAMIGAVAVPCGCQSILLVNGYNYEDWNASRREIARLKEAQDTEGLAAYMRGLYNRTPEDFNWNRRVLAYETVPNAYAHLPDACVTPTCGSAVGFLGTTLVIAGGEDKGAHRTREIQTSDFAPKRTFGWLNWTVLLVYLGMLIPFGFYFKTRANASSEDYFRGGGRIPWWVNGLSIYATMLSSITFIAFPTIVYMGDWRYFPNSFSLLIITYLVIVFYIPRFCKLNFTSAYEYLEVRFNLFTRIFASGAFIIFMIARSAVVIYIPALVLNTVAGLDIYLSILLIGGISLLYTTMGGMEAVAWADFLQSVILVGSALFIMIFLALGSGGFMQASQIAYDAGKFRLFDFGWDWSQPVLWVTLGGSIQFLSSYTSDQTVIQRYITMTNTKDTIRSMWLNGILGVAGLVIFYFIGTFLFTFYHTNPAKFDVTLYQNDAVLPTLMVTQMVPGVVGLMVAAVFAATISTISGNFNSSAAAFVTDFFCRFSRYTKEDQATLRMSLYATAGTGILAILSSLFLASMPDIKSLFDIFITVIGILTGGLCGLFFVGFFMKNVGATGAIAGLFASYVVSVLLVFDGILGFQIAHKPHSLLYSLISLVVCVLVSAFVSIFCVHKNCKKSS